MWDLLIELIGKKKKKTKPKQTKKPHPKPKQNKKTLHRSTSSHWESHPVILLIQNITEGPEPKKAAPPQAIKLYV